MFFRRHGLHELASLKNKQNAFIEIQISDNTLYLERNGAPSSFPGDLLAEAIFQIRAFCREHKVTYDSGIRGYGKLFVEGQEKMRTNPYGIDIPMMLEACSLQYLVDEYNKRNRFYNPKLQAKPAVNQDPIYNPEITKQFILDIKKSIKDSNFPVGSFLCMSGGINIIIDGEKKRVPHRVARIYKLIEQFDFNKENSSKDFRDLLIKIIDAADEALDSPRFGQKTMTRVFYTELMNRTLKVYQHGCTDAPSIPLANGF